MTRSTLRLPWTLMALALAALAVSCSGTESVRDFNLESMMRDMEKRSDAIGQARVDFTKTRRLASFSKPMTVKGRLILRKPNFFRLTLCGDVLVEVISDGSKLFVIHDLKSIETHTIHGDRDLVQFADPLMALVQGIGQGSLRDYSILTKIVSDDEIMVEAKPARNPVLERVQRLFLWLAPLGEIKRARITFADGDIDDTVFDSWSILAEDDPDVLFMLAELDHLKERANTRRRISPPIDVCSMTQGLFAGGILSRRSLQQGRPGNAHTR